jgi:hypothetical protein
MRKLIAYLKGGTPVILRDWTGETYKTIAYTNVFDERVAAVYWFEGVGHVILSDNGKIHPESRSSYITKWEKG